MSFKACVEHTLSPGSEGYARTSFNGQLTFLHRKVYCQTNNTTLDDIKGLVVRHTCDNPRCIEPSHLLIGTRGDNNRDRASRGRSADRHGEAHPLSRLKDVDIVSIREKYATGQYTQSLLAKEYNCDPSQISRIVNKLVWRKT